MEQSGQYRIPAARAIVWDALNDADVLQACIEGCESVTKLSDHRFDANITAKLGPVKTKFKATIEVSDRNPPESYSLDVSVKGGMQGFGKGRAEVELAEDQNATLLSYRVEGNVGGKLAQMGSRLITAAGLKMAEGFFSKFSEGWADTI
ncbi:MAG: carbon monoxide dehydrogenase subunit G [Pseudomonadales bacterium]|nr:carbon monoxide dehydrogenase subunit G [Pseudomonadales bacterium]